jgi:hypothetical protein
MKIAQDNIETTLAAYNLPLYSYENRWKKWKDVAISNSTLSKWWDITKTITVPWKTPILLKLWWKYDNNWNLVYNIVTIYP